MRDGLPSIFFLECLTSLLKFVLKCKVFFKFQVLSKFTISDGFFVRLYFVEFVAQRYPSIERRAQ